MAKALDKFFTKVTLPALIVLIVLAGTFAPTPPPVRYLTVKVVFDGAIP